MFSRLDMNITEDWIHKYSTQHKHTISVDDMNEHSRNFDIAHLSGERNRALGYSSSLFALKIRVNIMSFNLHTVESTAVAWHDDDWIYASYDRDQSCRAEQQLPHRIQKQLKLSDTKRAARSRDHLIFQTSAFVADDFYFLLLHAKIRLINMIVDNDIQLLELPVYVSTFFVSSVKKENLCFNFSGFT